jgi:hypothetical protein
MKAITLTEPWATLVALNEKKVETRSWSTAYRGPIAIHSAKAFPAWARDLCLVEPFRSVLFRAGFAWGQLANPRYVFDRGCVIAISEICGMIRISQHFETILVNGLHIADPKQELAFGDYAPRRFAWRLGQARRLSNPIPAKGALGLWEWDAPESVKELLG